VKKVYDVIYGGGDNGQTKMMTIGYACYLPKGILNPIIANRSDAIAELKRKRYQTMLRYQKKGFGIIKVKEVKSVKSVKKGKTNSVGRPAMSNSQKIRRRLEQGWNNKDIAKYYNISIKSVGGVSAHFNNPKSFKNRKKVK